MRWFPRRVARHEGDTRRSNSHGVPPTSGKLPDEIGHALDETDPGYIAAIVHLGAQLRGKVVADSDGGHSGYVLRFTDGAWVAVWLDPALARMEALMGVGDPPPQIVARISNPGIPDASGPLNLDRPYASEPNDIAGEAERTHGEAITGDVSVGENAFSLCFPNDMELEGTVFPTADGRFALRVFFEQW